MRFDSWQVKELWTTKVVNGWFGHISLHTSRISLSLIDPCMSCLFAKTRSEAPASLWESVNLGDERNIQLSLHPREAGCEAPSYSPEFACDLLSLQPRQWHPFARNNSANMAEEFSGHQRPLLTW